MHEAGPWYNSFSWIRSKERGGSSTLLGGCHAIDAMRFLVGQEADTVTAFSTTGHRKDFEYDPTLAGVIKFKDGSLAHLTATQELHMPYVFPVEVMGSLGAIRDGKVWSEKLKGQSGWVAIPATMPDSGHVTHHPFPEIIDHLVDCILNGRESHVSAEDAVKTHEIVFALDQSAAQGGKPVKLPLLS
jgi:predicted dehydrogenase